MAQAAKTLEKLGAAWADVVPSRAAEFDFPEELGYMWTVFTRLDSARTCGSTPNPITFQDILAYQKLYRIEFDEWELKLIRTLDGIRLKALYARLGNAKP